MLRLLVVEGNAAAGRRRWIEATGMAPAESYAAVLREIAPDAVVEICRPADADAGLPQPIDSYDGIAITGSGLNIYRREIESLRQIDFVREVFARGVPLFGSCWGLQLATVAAGGDVQLNPAGREVAFARKVMLTAAGHDHAMHAGRAPVFDAPAMHSDIVTRLPEGATVTAFNATSEVQAAEIRCGRGIAWAVQYHPEYSLDDVAAVIRICGPMLVTEGFYAGPDEADAHAADIARIPRDAGGRRIAWRLGLDDDLLTDSLRRTELVNWLGWLRGRSAASR